MTLKLHLDGIGYVQIFWDRIHSGTDPLCLHGTGSELERYSSILDHPSKRRISCHGINYSQPYFFKRNQSSDNRSHGFGAKFLLKKLSASDFSYEKKSTLSGPIWYQTADPIHTGYLPAREATLICLSVRFRNVRNVRCWHVPVLGDLRSHLS